MEQRRVKAIGASEIGKARRADVVTTRMVGRLALTLTNVCLSGSRKRIYQRVSRVRIAWRLCCWIKDCLRQPITLRRVEDRVGPQHRHQLGDILIVVIFYYELFHKNDQTAFCTLLDCTAKIARLLVGQKSQRRPTLLLRSQPQQNGVCAAIGAHRYRVVRDTAACDRAPITPPRHYALFQFSQNGGSYSGI